MDQKKIGSFLKVLRKEQGITQEQFAEQLNVSGRTVSRWETGSNMPDISLLIEIAEFFDVSIPEIINGERKSGDMEKEKEVKEVAGMLSDYADAEKALLLKRVKVISIVGLAAMAAGLVMELPLADTAVPVFSYIKGVCAGLTAGALITTLLYTTGILARLRAKKVRNMRILLVFGLVVLVGGLIAAIAASVGA